MGMPDMLSIFLDLCVYIYLTCPNFAPWASFEAYPAFHTV